MKKEKPAQRSRFFLWSADFAERRFVIGLKREAMCEMNREQNQRECSVSEQSRSQPGAPAVGAPTCSRLKARASERGSK
jgi:hypothetical protein